MRDRADGRPGGVVGVALDQPDLVEVRERQVRRRGQDLDGAGHGPSVAVLDAAVTNRGQGPGRRVECGVGAGLVVLDREAEPCADLVQVGGVAASAVHRVLWGRRGYADVLAGGAAGGGVSGQLVGIVRDCGGRP